MSSPQLETFLAQLYTDQALRQRFLEQPHAVAAAAGVTQQEARALAAIDRTGLQMAATSFAHKRAAHSRHRGPWKKLLRWIAIRL